MIGIWLKHNVLISPAWLGYKCEMHYFHINFKPPWDSRGHQTESLSGYLLHQDWRLLSLLQRSSRESVFLFAKTSLQQRFNSFRGDWTSLDLGKKYSYLSKPFMFEKQLLFAISYFAISFKTLHPPTILHYNWWLRAEGCVEATLQCEKPGYPDWSK